MTSSSAAATSENARIRMPTIAYRLLVHSARQLVQVSATRERRLTGVKQMNSLAVLERRDDGQGVSVVVDR